MEVPTGEFRALTAEVARLADLEQKVAEMAEAVDRLGRHVDGMAMAILMQEAYHADGGRPLPAGKRHLRLVEDHP